MFFKCSFSNFYLERFPDRNIIKTYLKSILPLKSVATDLFALLWWIFKYVLSVLPFQICYLFQDSNGKDLQLGVSAVGLLVFQNGLRTNTFSWSKMVKVSFKRKDFFIQLRREPVISNQIYFNVVNLFIELLLLID